MSIVFFKRHRTLLAAVTAAIAAAVCIGGFGYSYRLGLSSDVPEFTTLAEYPRHRLESAESTITMTEKEGIIFSGGLFRQLLTDPVQIGDLVIHSYQYTVVAGCGLNTVWVAEVHGFDKNGYQVFTHTPEQIVRLQGDPSTPVDAYYSRLCRDANIVEEDAPSSNKAKPGNKQEAI